MIFEWYVFFSLVKDLSSNKNNNFVLWESCQLLDKKRPNLELFQCIACWKKKAWEVEQSVKNGFELQGFVAQMKDCRDKCVGKSDDGTSDSESLRSPRNATLTHQRTISTQPFEGDDGLESVKTLNLDNFVIQTTKL